LWVFFSAGCSHLRKILIIAGFLTYFRQLKQKLIFCFFTPLLNSGEEDEEDGDYTFGNSYSALVDHLKKDLQIEINTPIASVAFSNTDQGEESLLFLSVAFNDTVSFSFANICANFIHSLK